MLLMQIINPIAAETTIKSLANSFSLFLCLLNTLVLPHVSPQPHPCHGMVYPVLLGTVNNKPSFQWQLLPDTLVLLDPKFSINHYILKHWSNLSPSLTVSQWTCLKKGSSPA